MIPQKPLVFHTDSWQKEWQEAIRDQDTLLKELKLSNLCFSTSGEDFPLLVPRPFLSRMRVGDPTCPLLRQVMHQPEEREDTGETDPLEEQTRSPVPGLLHKFAHQVLLTAAKACPVHCRYCFRRHYPYEAHIGRQRLWGALTYIAEHPAIKEVIFSGGDPLSLPDKLIADALSRLSEIPHVETIRFHTRFPVMIPSRITDHLLAAFSHARQPIAMVLHMNHAQEMDEGVRAAMQRLQRHGVRLFNQSVLLRGVNDDAGTLETLSWTLWSAGITPYYVHLFDPVRHAMHFDVPIAQARHIQSDLAKRLPGYLLPRFVKEVPGRGHKISLDNL